MQSIDINVLNQSIDSLIQGINDYYFDIPGGLFESTSPIFLSLYIIVFTIASTLWLAIVILVVQFEIVRKRGGGGGV